MSIYKKHLTLLIVCCGIISFKGMGQASQSPFTTFGIGEKFGNALIHNQGMAGVGIGAPQYWYLNNQNPALLVYNSLTLFEAGILYESKTIKSSTESEKTKAGNMNYLAMAFPIKPGKWTSSVGLTPFTNVDYRFQYDDPIIGSANTARVAEQGSGGLTQFYWSNGIRLARNLAVGVKASYIFGSVLNEYSNFLNETTQPVPYVIKISEKVYVRDLGFTGGISYRKDSVMAGNYTFTAGAIYSLATNLNATRTVRFSRTTGLDQVIDSLTLQSSKGRLYIPEEVGFGFSLAKSYKWMVGADVFYQDWSKFRGLTSEDEEGLVKSWGAAIGAEFTPDIYAIDNFLKRITYRAGISMEKLPFLANDKEVKDFGINFGLSLPTGRSSLDMAFRVGKRGNRSENILEENYFKVYFGLTLNDQWFIKRKFE